LPSSSESALRISVTSSSLSGSDATDGSVNSDLSENAVLRRLSRRERKDEEVRGRGEYSAGEKGALDAAIGTERMLTAPSSSSLDVAQLYLSLTRLSGPRGGPIFGSMASAMKLDIGGEAVRDE
jgi:hypothetical protein